MAISNIISKSSSFSGNISGDWMRGLSAYELAVRNGFKGSVSQWLESVKATSIFVESVEETENGVIVVLKDGNGSHELFLPKGEKGDTGEDGFTPIISANPVEGGMNITIQNKEDIIRFLIPDGEIGPQGEPGREVIFMATQDGVVYWRYTKDDNNWKQLVDLGTLADNKFNEALDSHRAIVFVSELPEPENADPNLIYILRQEE